MRFGVNWPNIGDPAEIVALAVSLEQAGWDGFFLWDHLQLNASARLAMLDPWVLLGAIATQTSRITLGTLVTPVPRRRPWKLAKEIITVDHLSGGRVILGVGLGDPPQDEYAAFGEPAAQQLHAAQLDEALPLLDAFLRGDPVDHAGEHYQVTAHLAPPAAQRPRPPIWVGATLPFRRGVRRAARWDGIAPVSPQTLTPSPQEMADLVVELAPPSGYDVVVQHRSGAAVGALADAGATWALTVPRRSEYHAEGRRHLLAGPPTAT